MTRTSTKFWNEYKLRFESVSYLKQIFLENGARVAERFSWKGPVGSVGDGLTSSGAKDLTGKQHRTGTHRRTQLDWIVKLSVFMK